MTGYEKLDALEKDEQLLDKFIKEIFLQIDKNNDGFIQWIELTVFLITLSNKLVVPIPTPHDVDDVMDEYRKDKDKVKDLTLEEITPLVRKIIQLLKG